MKNVEIISYVHEWRNGGKSLQCLGNSECVHYFLIAVKWWEAVRLVLSGVDDAELLNPLSPPRLILYCP